MKNKENRKAKKVRTYPVALYIVLGVLIPVFTTLLFVTRWVDNTLGVGLDDIYNTLLLPTKDSSPVVVGSAVSECLPFVICSVVFVLVAILADVVLRYLNRNRHVEDLPHGPVLAVSVAIYACSAVYLLVFALKPLVSLVMRASEVFPIIAGAEYTYHVVEEGAIPVLISIPFVITLIYFVTGFLCLNRRGNREYDPKKPKVLKAAKTVYTVCAVLFFVFTVLFVQAKLDFVGYFATRFSSTKIYEEYYVDPDDVEIKADGDERNLIYIYLESLETTYASEDVGGHQKYNLIPNLTRLALYEDNISFSDDDRLGGYHNTNGSGWTIGSMFTSSSGVPFNFPVEKNSMNLYEAFAPGLTVLGDILEENGYTQMFMCGSKANFGGRKEFYEQHGNYTIFDLTYARKNGYLPEDYWNDWWGFEDYILYDFAKEQLLELAESGSPFNFTMLTVDTHMTEGFVCDLCQTQYKSKAANVVDCADRQLGEFIEWVKAQDFYENTTVVIIGDHPRMDTYLVNGIEYYERTAYNCFMNTGREVTDEVKNNRIFTSMDLFPTVLSAMGFEIEGNRLGLGTDMFSGEQTLAEQIGYDYLNNEVAKYSEYYNKNFIALQD